MRIAVLGASGRVGGHLVEQAAQRGHDVVALVRDPSGYAAPASVLRKVEARQADVRSPQRFPGIGDADVVVSALGIRKADGPGALVAGARALAATGVRTIWLGALGSGVSTGAGGRLYQVVMRMFVGRELAEKAEADRIALSAGAIVIHAPDLGNGALSSRRKVLRLADYPRPVLPPRITRATLAGVMLDVAESDEPGGGILVPVG